jgi:hypothetical protein
MHRQQPKYFKLPTPRASSGGVSADSAQTAYMVILQDFILELLKIERNRQPLMMAVFAIRGAED